MKIIQVVGRSNTGKTTLIRQLVPELGKQGRVGVIKHLADHNYWLDPSKDTTEFFSAGAAITVGIDAEKSVAIVRSAGLSPMLALLDGQGMDFAVIEGFKTEKFPRIVVGDLVTDGEVLRNPSVADVIAKLDRFADYRRPESAIR